VITPQKALRVADVRLGSLCS